MAELRVLLVLFVVNAFGQNCIKYGAPTTLTGTLLLRDEAGYNQFIALRLVRAICTVGDPKGAAYPGDEPYPKQSGVREIQAGVYGSDPASIALRDRLDRLTGHRVVLKGVLFAAHTGYHRTNVQFGAEAVDPVDTAGQQALLAPKVAFKPQDVDDYDVTVNAGRRLVIVVHKSGSTTPLLPSDQYVSHWMTGGEVLYVDCRDGYERSLISSTEKDGGICLPGDNLCGLSAFPKKPVILKLRCTRRP